VYLVILIVLLMELALVPVGLLVLVVAVVVLTFFHVRIAPRHPDVDGAMHSLRVNLDL